MKRKAFTFFVVSVTLAFIYFKQDIRDFIEIDKCLDRGGRYDYDRKQCETE